MKARDFRQKTKEELENLLANLKERLQFLENAVRLKKVKNVREIRGLKKDIARIFTILKEKENI